MRQERITGQTKGWLVGPWNSSAPYAVGWSRHLTDVQHLHNATNETYVVVSGSGTLQVNGERLAASPGDVFQVDAGEPHGWVTTSPDFLMIMIHCPVDPADKVLLDGGD